MQHWAFIDFKKKSLKSLIFSSTEKNDIGFELHEDKKTYNCIIIKIIIIRLKICIVPHIFK